MWVFELLEFSKSAFEVFIDEDLSNHQKEVRYYFFSGVITGLIVPLAYIIYLKISNSRLTKNNKELRTKLLRVKDLNLTNKKISKKLANEINNL